MSSPAPAASPASPPARRSPLLIAGLLVVVLLIGGGVAWYLQNQSQRQAQARELYRLKNLAIGQIENGSLEAEKTLQQLIEQVPSDPVAVRNLVISRLQVLRIGKLPDGTAIVGKVDPRWLPASRLQEIEPQAASTWILSALCYEKLEEAPQALAAARKGTELAPDDASVWYRLFKITTEMPDLHATPEGKQEARRALDAIVRLDDRNLKALLELGPRQAEAKEKTGFATTIDVLEEVLTPIAAEIERRTNDKALERLTAARASAAEGNWEAASGSLKRVHNVVKGEEWYQSDLRRLERNELSYLVLDFLPENDPHSVLPAEPEIPPIPVKLVRLEDSQQPEALPKVQDIQVADFDLDDRPDLWAVTDDELHVLSQKEAAGKWSTAARIPPTGGMRALLLADLDRDEPKPQAGAPQEPAAPDATKARHEQCQPGDVDAVAFGAGGVSVLRNDLPENGARVLTLVPQTRGLEKLRNVQAAVLADIDHDGDLDLVLSTPKVLSIWALESDLQFVDISTRSELPENVAATCLVAVDWDRDADLDVLVAGNQPGYLEGLRHGMTRWHPFAPTFGLRAGTHWLNLVEFDGNASWDLFVKSNAGARLLTTRTLPARSVDLLADRPIGPQSHAQGITWDFDNDSNTDLAAWGAGENVGLTIYRGRPQNGAERVDGLFDKPPSSVRACAAADLDSDGDLELIVAEDERMAIYRNDGGNKNKWLSIKCQGLPTDQEIFSDVNHLAIGSLIEVRTGPRYQAQVVTGQVTHFGLGQQTDPDMLRTVWTNGVSQPSLAPGANLTICKKHDPVTSCPYLYTWTGEKYEFCTDACWAAPLGLQFAEGIYAKPRAWEYLTIPGDRLRLRNGRYSVQFTEELWEAMYLDKCELLAIDHPAGTSICSNEKVGPAELAAFRIHTIAKPRLPVAARDKRGRDVLELVSEADERYVKAFDRSEAQGLTEEHFLELDLGKLQDPKQITLFLTGWLFPTPTSTNVRLSQRTKAPVMRPPALWVPDEKGEWKEVQPFMGFPGGKTKTIAVDLSKAFLTDDYRLRIVTNMEFYWDAASFTVDDEPVELKVSRLPVSKADLHFRGASAMHYPPHFGPQRYDYSDVRTAPVFPPMRGKFTRYGPVTELLQSEDNRMAIFTWGDELTIEFDPPKDNPPAGWTRDFVLYNSGWDKDCDLNVVYGQDVEPLPFQGMSGYPYRADEAYPDTPETREYLRTYQTREVNRAAFWRRLHGVQP